MADVRHLMCMHMCETDKNPEPDCDTIIRLHIQNPVCGSGNISSLVQVQERRWFRFSVINRLCIIVIKALI